MLNGLGWNKLSGTDSKTCAAGGGDSIPADAPSSLIGVTDFAFVARTLLCKHASVLSTQRRQDRRENRSTGCKMAHLLLEYC